jgi:hypothetical protein
VENPYLVKGWLAVSVWLILNLVLLFDVKTSSGLLTEEARTLKIPEPMSFQFTLLTNANS